MTDTVPSDELLAASRLIGADILFLQLVELVAAKQKAIPKLRDSRTVERIAQVHAQFQRSCAAIIERHLGREQATSSLAALETAPLQRYLAARQAMAPTLSQQLGALQQRMGSLEI